MSNEDVEVAMVVAVDDHLAEAEEEEVVKSFGGDAKPQRQRDSQAEDKQTFAVEVTTSSSNNNTTTNAVMDRLRAFEDRWKYNVPRLYYVVTRIVLPLLTLIAMSLLFGGILAQIEMPQEIQRNNDILIELFQGYSNHTAQRKNLWHIMANTSIHCFEEQNQQDMIIPNNLTTTTTTTTETTETVENCSLQAAMEQFPQDDIVVYLVESNPDLTFDWMECYQEPNELLEYQGMTLTYNDYFAYFGLNPKSNYDQQYLGYIFRFGDDLEAKINEVYPHLQLDDIVANSDTLGGFVKEATGSEGCQVHTAGGALFFFTVMTTVGYGNTAPTTDGGRLLIYTCGFVSIIAFLLLNNTAANVWKFLFEDYFLQHNLACLVQGPLSVLFWLGMTALWMLLLAFSMQHWQGMRSNEVLSLKDAYWFSYITTTTVGLGDIHVAHEEFKIGDMFIMPLAILLGFNFLGIFAAKLVDLYNLYFPEECGLKDILQQKRGGGGVVQDHSTYDHNNSPNSC